MSPSFSDTKLHIGSMNNTKIFITGSAGLIGSSLYTVLKQTDFVVYGVDSAEGISVDCVLDVSLKAQLKQKLNEFNPQIIIHAAAIKSLTNCEDDKLRSWDVNVESTAEIVQYAKIHDVKIVYISSDVVFDGKVGNYKEIDQPNPINWYGTTKYHSELLIREIPNSVICRTALVLGNLRDGDKKQLVIELESDVLNNQSLLPYFVLDRLKNGQKVMLPNQIISSPTHIDLLKTAVIELIKKNLKGIYHCTGSEPVSRYDFAIKIAEFFNLDKTLIEVDESNILAIRPKNLSMNVKNTYEEIGLKISDWNIENLINKLF